LVIGEETLGQILVTKTNGEGDAISQKEAHVVHHVTRSPICN